MPVWIAGAPHRVLADFASLTVSVAKISEAIGSCPDAVEVEAQLDVKEVGIVLNPSFRVTQRCLGEHRRADRASEDARSDS